MSWVLQHAVKLPKTYFEMLKVDPQPFHVGLVPGIDVILPVAHWAVQLLLHCNGVVLFVVAFVVTFVVTFFVVFVVVFVVTFIVIFVVVVDFNVDFELVLVVVVFGLFKQWFMSS